MHSLQLQASAAFRLLTPVKSRHATPSSSSLLLHELPTKCLNPSRHDVGMWNDALRYTAHLSGTSVSQQDHTPSLLLELYRLARKHNNLKLARAVIQRHINSLVGSSLTQEVGLSDAVEGMRSSVKITALEKFFVMRELSKLYACLGQTSHAVNHLATSIVTYCQEQSQDWTGKGQFRVAGNESTGRSLVTLVKWLQSESRLLQTVANPEYEIGRKLERLFESEEECRNNHLGLYQSAGENESSSLFEPDVSVARQGNVFIFCPCLSHFPPFSFPLCVAKGLRSMSMLLGNSFTLLPSTAPHWPRHGGS